MEIKVEFIYEDRTYNIVCLAKDELKSMFDKFIKELNNGSQIDEYSFYYEGQKLKEDKNKKTIEKNDLIGGKSQITIKVQKNLKVLKCPDCNYNDCILVLRNNKVKFYGCEHNHTSSTTYDKYKKKQIMIPSDIRCCVNGCNNDQENDKSDFYFCLTCSEMFGKTKSYCTKCMLTHSDKHIRVNFDRKNYYCKDHFQKFIKYCFDCKKNLCEKCQTEHSKHKVKSYSIMAPNEVELQELKDSLKKIEEMFSDLKNSIDDIIYSLNGTLRLFQNYYEIANDIIYKYEKFNKNEDKEKEFLNYAILRTLRNLKFSNINIAEDIESLIKQKDIIKRSTAIISIYKDKKDNYAGNAKKDSEEEKDIEWLNNIDENEKNERLREEERKKEEEKKRKEEEMKKESEQRQKEEDERRKEEEKKNEEEKKKRKKKNDKKRK